MDLQNVSNINVPQGEVRTIHDKDSRLLWGRVSYDTTYRGDTQQTSYTGKNLLNVPSSYSFTVGPISISLPAGTYHLSCGNVTKGSTNNPVVVIANSAKYLNSNTDITFTLTSDITEVYFYSNGWNYSASVGVTSTVVNLMISTSGGVYEPYVGGIPSPNPDYPQDIDVVTGMQDVTIRGKNMYDYTTLSLTSGCVATDYGFEKTVTSTSPTGTFYSNSIYNPIGTFTVSFEARIDNANTATLVLGGTSYIWNKGSLTLKDANGNTADTTYRTLGSDWRKFNFTVTTTESLQWSAGKAMHLYYNTVTNSPELQVRNFQIESGSTATSYEAYVGRTYEINLRGRNLFDGVMEDGGFNNYGINQATTNRIRSKNYTPVSPSTTYTIKVNQWDTSKGSVCGVSVSYYDKNDYVTSRIDYMNWANGGNGVSFTTPSGCKYVRFLVTIGATPGATTNITYTDVSEIQIELGTAYTPYFTPIELAKIGTYQDYIYKSGGNWYVHKAVGKGVLDGSENYWIYQNGVFPAVFTDAMRDTYKNKVIVMSDYFIGQTTRYRDEISNLYCAKIVGENSQIGFRYDAMNGDVPTWRSWLSTHNITVYYVLATPTDTQITDVTLLSQLNAVHQWLTRYGYQYGVVGTLPIIIDQEDLN